MRAEGATADDPRIQRLPHWARELISSQKGRINMLEKDVEDLRDHRDGFIAAEEDSDTVRVSDRTVAADGRDLPDMPLGSGALIRFADWYQVSYGDVGNGARALIVETDGDMAVVPGHPARVVIRRA
jgi:hypothetical protein